MQAFIFNVLKKQYLSCFIEKKYYINPKKFISSLLLRLIFVVEKVQSFFTLFLHTFFSSNCGSNWHGKAIILDKLCVKCTISLNKNLVLWIFISVNFNHHIFTYLKYYYLPIFLKNHSPGSLIFRVYYKIVWKYTMHLLIFL